MAKRSVIGDEDAVVDLNNQGEEAFGGIKDLNGVPEKIVGERQEVVDMTGPAELHDPHVDFQQGMADIWDAMVPPPKPDGEADDEEVEEDASVASNPASEAAKPTEGAPTGDDEFVEAQAPSLDEEAAKETVTDPARDEIEEEFSKILEDTSRPKKTRADMDRLLKARRAEKERADELATRLDTIQKEYEAAKNTPKDDPVELEDARKYRALYVAERDPAIAREFDEPFNEANERAIAALGNVDQQTADTIRRYGFAAVAEKNPDWFEKVNDAVDSYRRTVLQGVISRQQELVTAKRSKLTSIMTDAKTYLEGKESAAKTQQEQVVQSQRATQERLSSWAKRTVEKSFITEDKIPSVITGEDRVAVKRAIDAAKTRLVEGVDFSKHTPETFAQTVYDAAHKQVYAEIARRAIERARKLERDMTAMSNVGKLPNGARRPASVPDTKPKPTEAETQGREIFSFLYDE